LLKFNKLDLYLDSIQRFTTKQFLYWIYNKQIKPLCFDRQLKSIGKALNHSIEFEEFLKRTKKILTFRDNKSLLWNAYVKNDELVHPYFFQIEKVIEAYAKSKDINVISSIWIDKNIYPEISNNNHRFHQFSDNLSGYNDDLIIELINNWILQISPSKGNAWNSFNCTLRVLNWLRMLMQIKTSSSYANEHWKEIEHSMFVQAAFISKNIEHHIPGNHVAIQYYVLWLFSNVFPEWKNSIPELINSEKLFVTEFINEFLECGLHFEQSFHYHIQITLIGLYYLQSKHNLNEEIEEEYLNTLRKATEIVDCFISKDQYIPMLSDNCFTFFHKNLSEDTSNISSLSENLFGLSDGTKTVNPIVYLQNQYIIVNLEDSKLIFDVGNIGLESNPGHGHSDLLSFIYSYKKHPIFIDPGTRKYSLSQEDLLLKKTSSHNTISIGSEDQAKLWGFFRWAYLPMKLKYSIEQNENGTILSGEYLGFKKNGRIKHKRVVTLSNSIFEIEDYVYGLKGRTLSINFILHPDVLVTGEGQKLSINKNINFELSISSEFDYQMIVEPFNVYPEYDIPVSSRKIRVDFLTNDKPFYSKTSLLIPAVVENEKR
jgi:hypothetical protein